MFDIDNKMLIVMITNECIDTISLVHSLYSSCTCTFETISLIYFSKWDPYNRSNYMDCCNL